MLWDRNELLLGTWKTYSKFIGNIKRTHCEQEKSKTLPPSPPKKMIWDKT
jgi:hypothetical protein